MAERREDEKNYELYHKGTSSAVGEKERWRKSL